MKCTARLGIALWLLASLATLLAGCTTSRVPTKSEVIEVTSYELGEVEEGNTGDAIITVGHAIGRPTFTPLRTFTPPKVGRAGQASVRLPDLEPGQRWEATYQIGDDGGYMLRHDAFGDKAIHIMPDGTVGEGWVPSSSLVVLNQDDKVWPREEPLFVRVPGMQDPGSFRADLVYSGKSNDVIRLVYREYFDGMARSAFTQELEYDLKESREITFRSLVIEVLEATNNGIRFEVVEDGGLPWLPRV